MATDASSQAKGDSTYSSIVVLGLLHVVFESHSLAVLESLR